MSNALLQQHAETLTGIVIYLNITETKIKQFIVRDAFVRTSRHAVAMMFVRRDFVVDAVSSEQPVKCHVL